jgi:hypothetical protein
MCKSQKHCLNNLCVSNENMEVCIAVEAGFVTTIDHRFQLNSDDCTTYGGSIGDYLIGEIYADEDAALQVSTNVESVCSKEFYLINSRMRCSKDLGKQEIRTICL